MLEPVVRYLRRLRLQLSLLYLLAALVLVFVIGLGSYGLLQYYFQFTTDQALEYKMAQVFRQYGLALPSALSQAEAAWLAEIPRELPARVQPATKTEDDHDEDDGESHSPDENEDRHEDEAYDGQLAAVFFMPFDNQGQALLAGPTSLPSSAISLQAFAAAQQNGSDRRTIRLTNGRRVRLLTYRAPEEAGPAYFLVGRLLTDQDRIIGLYLIGLVVLGSAIVLFLGLGGWWLSGRTLHPAQQAWDQQQAFVANASHELRAPLTLIRATADYGLRSSASDQYRQSLTEIVQECDYMSRLVNDLLLLSRLDAGQLALEPQPIALETFLPEVIAQAQKIATEKGISLRMPAAAGVVFADPTRLRQILWILLDNALNHTPAGKEIRVGSQVAGKQVEIFVEDTGAGIQPEHLPHVFERFSQATQPGSDPGRSNGLGLSIGRALVEAQHGEITIASQVGQGTRVQVTFPAKPQ